MRKSSFQTIVAGVDLSNYSRIVAEQARVLADAFDAALVFVHVLNSAYYMLDRPAYADAETEILEPMRKEVRHFYNLNRDSENPEAQEIIVRFGRPSDVLIDVAGHYKNPLIIVGHRGHGRLGRFFLGSTAETLALGSPYPVWIHRGKEIKVPHAVLLPCDYSERASQSLKTASSLDQGQLKLEFLHVSHLPIPLLDEAQWHRMAKELQKEETVNRKKFRARFPDVPLKSLFGEPAEAISSESKNFDLIAMAPHNRKKIFSSFGSVTAKVVRQGDVPILITH